MISNKEVWMTVPKTLDKNGINQASSYLSIRKPEETIDVCRQDVVRISQGAHYKMQVALNKNPVTSKQDEG